MLDKRIKQSDNEEVLILDDGRYPRLRRDGADGVRLIEPATGEPYCDRSWDFPYKITHDDLCFRLFTEAGFEWGGDWTTRKDYQHFEIM